MQNETVFKLGPLERLLAVVITAVVVAHLLLDVAETFGWVE